MGDTTQAGAGDDTLAGGGDDTLAGAGEFTGTHSPKDLIGGAADSLWGDPVAGRDVRIACGGSYETFRAAVKAGEFAELLKAKEPPKAEAEERETEAEGGE